MDENWSTETWQFKAFTHIFVMCVHLVEDSADLDSIEAVANEVLNMEMPSTPQQLQALTEDIRERVESLSDVEVILQQSAGDIARAEMLLEEAKKARYTTLFCIGCLQWPRTGMRLWFHYQEMQFTLPQGWFPIPSLKGKNSPLQCMTSAFPCTKVEFLVLT